MNDPKPSPAPLNPLQRWVLERCAPRYAKLSPELRMFAIERDRFLLGGRSVGLWVGTVCGIAGSTYGLAAASPSISAWLAFFLVLVTFAGLWKAGMSAWLRPERFTGRRLWRLAFLAMIATYAGAIASFRGRLGEWVASGTPWFDAVMLVVWRATPLQLMVFVAALLLLSVVSTARRETLRRALDQARAEHERDAAAAQLTQARLSLLQAQIQPHFLFNTLAALQLWVDVGDARAAPLLRALTGFLRGSTELMLQGSVTLAQECETVRHYLEIMQSRLGGRLRFVIDVAPECEAQSLPPGLLITLVENAVEHGIEPRLRGGEVRVTARRLEGVFELRVLDDGPGLAPGAQAVTEGIGLTNSRARLQHQFGERAQLQLKARTDGPGTEVRLQLFDSPPETPHTRTP